MGRLSSMLWCDMMWPTNPGFHMAQYWKKKRRKNPTCYATCHEPPFSWAAIISGCWTTSRTKRFRNQVVHFTEWHQTAKDAAQQSCYVESDWSSWNLVSAVYLDELNSFTRHLWIVTLTIMPLASQWGRSNLSKCRNYLRWSKCKHVLINT
jgi:hypothetical protein